MGAAVLFFLVRPEEAIFSACRCDLARWNRMASFALVRSWQPLALMLAKVHGYKSEPSAPDMDSAWRIELSPNLQPATQHTQHTPSHQGKAPVAFGRCHWSLELLQPPAQSSRRGRLRGVLWLLYQRVFDQKDSHSEDEGDVRSLDTLLLLLSSPC